LVLVVAFTPFGDWVRNVASLLRPFVFLQPAQLFLVHEVKLSTSTNSRSLGMGANQSVEGLQNDLQAEVNSIKTELQVRSSMPAPAATYN
jgi:hypothetical protein